MCEKMSGGSNYQMLPWVDTLVKGWLKLQCISEMVTYISVKLLVSCTEKSYKLFVLCKLFRNFLPPSC